MKKVDRKPNEFPGLLREVQVPGDFLMFWVPGREFSPTPRQVHCARGSTRKAVSLTNASGTVTFEGFDKYKEITAFSVKNNAAPIACVSQ